MLLQILPEILLHLRWLGLGTPSRSVFIMVLLHPRYRGLGIPIRSVSILRRGWGLRSIRSGLPYSLT